MAGTRISIDYDNEQVLEIFNQLLERSQNVGAAMADIGASMLLSTEERFDQQRDPQGKPWKDLKADTWENKKHSKILSEEPLLRHSFTYQVDDEGVSWGTNVIYAAIHQLGGTINMPARSQKVFNKGWATIPAYQIEIPARSSLGVSKEDQQQILAIMREHLKK